MGWRDLFKSKDSQGNIDPTVRWFGKLPAYSDYYRSATEADWPVEFIDWIMRGFEAHQHRNREAVGHGMRLPPALVIVRLSNSGMTVFAAMRDYGGDQRGRPFPLFFFAGVPNSIWPGPTSDQAGSGVAVLEDLAAVHRHVPRFVNSPGRFDAVFGDREVSLQPIAEGQAEGSWLKAAEDVSLSAWFAATTCAATTAPESWLASVRQRGRQISELASDGFEATLRLPLATGFDLSMQVCGWLRWLESRMDMSRRLLSLVISGELERRGGHLAVIARRIAAEDFLLLSADSAPPAFVEDFCTIEAGTPATESEIGGSQAGMTGETWQSFVEAAP